MAVRRPTNANADWLVGFPTDRVLSIYQRDALIGVVWNALESRDVESESQVTSAELLSATALLAQQYQRDADPIIAHSIRLVLGLKWSEPKRAAIRALTRDPQSLSPIVRIAHSDQSWLARREAVGAIAEFVVQGDEQALDFLMLCADDPHWRVRFALMQSIVAWANQVTWPFVLERIRGVLLSAFARGTNDSKRRVNGLWSHLQAIALRSDELLFQDASTIEPQFEFDWQAEPDPRVLAWNIESRRRDQDTRLDLLAADWLGHSNEGVRKAAARRLELSEYPLALVALLQWCVDPRHLGAIAFENLVQHLDDDRLGWMINAALQDSRGPVVAWGMNLAGSVPLACVQLTMPEMLKLVKETLNHDSGAARFAAAKLAASKLDAAKLIDLQDISSLHGYLSANLDRFPTPVLELAMSSEIGELRKLAAARAGSHVSLCSTAKADRDPEVRAALARQVSRTDEAGMCLLGELQQDPHPHVRLAAMSDCFAESLVSGEATETSWAVLDRAAEVVGWSMPKIAMDKPLKTDPPQRSVRFQNSSPARVVIPGCEPVARLGLSGHYHLPEEGFKIAVDSGVGLMFFEPNYMTMTRFFRSLSPDDRHRIQLVAGTFEADPKAIGKDIDRVLRLLKRDHIDLFLFFWVRDWTRINDESLGAMERAKERGKIRRYSLSTHRLDLAAEAIRKQWAPVMVRHNAAHRRAEESVFPLAVESGTPAIVFNNTCYGRLLVDDPNSAETVSAADCYRFSLSKLGATACWTAPSTIDQLKENLQVLSQPAIEVAAEQRLLEQGAAVREMDHLVAKNIRYID